MISWRYLMKSVLSVATKRCYTEYASKKHSFKGCAFFLWLPDTKEKDPVIKKKCIKIQRI